MKFNHVSLDTRRFRFEAYGWTEKEALDALRPGLKRHAMQYGMPAHGFRR